MELFTPIEIAKKMNVDKFTPYKWMYSGQLKAIDVSQTGNVKARWVIREDDFNAFKQEYKNEDARTVKSAVSNSSTTDMTLLKEFDGVKNKLLELAIAMENLEKRMGGK